MRLSRPVFVFVFTLGCYLSHERPLEEDASVSLPDATVPPGDVALPPPVCAPNASTTYAGPGCTDEMHACMATCSGADCWSCYLSHPDCYDCEYFAYAKCVVRRSCQDLWDDVTCCRATHCTGIGLLACEETHCGREFVTFELCGEPFFDECAFAAQECGIR